MRFQCEFLTHILSMTDSFDGGMKETDMTVDV